MTKNEGVFAKGERLTASKLNDLAAGRPLSVAGHGSVNRSGGRDELELKPPEIIYIRLTEKDITKNPIRYGWKEVDRIGNPTTTVSATWGNMTERKAKKTDDYAIELNNQNLSVTDDYIYRAERSPSTGEWLFFLRRKQGTPIVLSLSIGTKASGCEPVPILVKDGMRAWGASAPTWYRIKSSTLRWKDYNGVWATIQTWDSLTVTEPSSYTFDAPYVPTATQPITFEYSAVTTDGTILGQESEICNPISTCQGNIYPAAWQECKGYTAGLFGCMASGCVPGIVVVTSPPGYPVAVKALMTASGHAVNNPSSITVPVEYLGKLSATGQNAAETAWLQKEETIGCIGPVVYEFRGELRVSLSRLLTKTFTVWHSFARLESSPTQGVWPDKNLYYIPIHVSEKCFATYSAMSSGFGDSTAYDKNYYFPCGFSGYDTHIVQALNILYNSTATFTPNGLC
jgi:hypothetical protein